MHRTTLHRMLHSHARTEQTLLVGKPKTQRRVAINHQFVGDVGAYCARRRLRCNHSTVRTRCAHSKANRFAQFQLDLSSLPTKCTHAPQWWARPWDGHAHFGPHPPLKGRQWYIPWSNWRESMLRWCEPNEPFITRNAVAYSTLLNQILAELWVRSAVAARVEKTQAHAMVKTGRWANTLVAGHLHRGNTQTDVSPHTQANTVMVI